MTLRSPAINTAWSTGEDTPSIRISKSGNYQTLIKDINGCIFHDTINIDYGPQIFVPNVFTPNYDGLNDGFQAYSIVANLDLYTLKVFDRWGGLKFHTNIQDASWNGEFKGEICNKGVYVYFIS